MNDTCVYEEVIACSSTYMCHDIGIILPLINEYTWHRYFRAFVYLFGLLYSFMGVAIVADLFMCSIEKITSKTRKIKVYNPSTPDVYDEIEVKVWNDTVANLTLMALGSSAPEILLSIIEICGAGFKAGDLGPGTIVGSAAFNLLVITAVCVMSIDSPDVRQIKSVKVFGVTAFFSIFAYLWLVIILMVITPDYVELWEAVITFFFFPILVVLAYVMDKDYCAKKQVDDIEQFPIGLDSRNSNQIDRDRMRDFIKQLKKIHPNLSEQDIAKLAAKAMSEEQSHDRLWYRINAIRHIGGGQKLTPQITDELEEIWMSMAEQKTEEVLGSGMVNEAFEDFSEDNTKAVVELAASQAAIKEGDGTVRVTLKRYGKMDCRVAINMQTVDGTAEAEKDYIPIKEIIVFDKNINIKHIDIDIIDDNEWEPDEVFFVKIALDSGTNQPHAKIGKKSVQEITIINDDEPGTFEFAKPSFLVRESAGVAQLTVERSNGADSKITVKWLTEDMTAKEGLDYIGTSGELIFEHGELSKSLEIPIKDDCEFEKDECFKVTLAEVNGGAKIGKTNKTVVTIVNDDEFNGVVSRLVNLTNMNMDALKVENTAWGDQFRNAMNVNGGDVQNASHLDYLMHFLTFGFKIIFACIPPPSIWGGWLAFIIALGFIAVLTALISDLASIFGCLVGLENSVTAITFVALGTSLPDLFASKQAATQEATADNSIGNVTGSNSVNVFLGLGLPWLIAAIYWSSKGETFKVEAGSLGFSVILYCVCALTAIIILVIRRHLSICNNGELGGPKGTKIATGVFFIFLWFLYIVLSILEAYKIIIWNF